MYFKKGKFLINSYIYSYVLKDLFTSVNVFRTILYNLLCIYIVIYTVSFSQLTHTAHEGNELVQLTLVLDNSPSANITMQVITTDGLAIGKQN